MHSAKRLGGLGCLLAECLPYAPHSGIQVPSLAPLSERLYRWADQMAGKRLRAFLDTNVLLGAIRGDTWSQRLFTPKAEKHATYVVNAVVLQELLLASAAAEAGPEIERLTRNFEVVGTDVLTHPDALAYVRKLRNRIVHTNDLLILGSARGCDILITNDKALLGLGDAAEVATATPEQFLTGLGVSQ